MADFQPLEKPGKHQVRFWGNKDNYKKFTAAVKKRGLYISDVFNEFMTWFIATF